MRQEQVNFDTYKHVKDFEKAGFAIGQAEALVNVISASREFDISRLATKEQLTNVEEKLSASTKSLEEKLTERIRASQAETIAIIKESMLGNLRWYIGITVSLMIALVGLAYKLFPHRL